MSLRSSLDSRPSRSGGPSSACSLLQPPKNSPFIMKMLLGTSLELRAKADTAEAAAWAEERILREIDRLSAISADMTPRASSVAGNPPGMS